jgi:hypothetical protein
MSKVFAVEVDSSEHYLCLALNTPWEHQHNQDDATVTGNELRNVFAVISYPLGHSAYFGR